MEILSRTISSTMPLIIFVLVMGTCGCKDDIPVGPPPGAGPVWVVHTTENSDLVDNSIHAIVVDDVGNKWVATDKGVSRFKNASWIKIQKELSFSLAEGVKSQRVNTITIAKDAGIWYGLAGGGVRRSDRFANSTSFTSVTTPELSSNMVYSLATDFWGNIWVGTANGVSRYTPDPVVPFTGVWWRYDSLNSIIPSEPIRSVAIDPADNSIWFGTYTQGLVSYDGDLDWNITSPSDQPFPIVSIAFTFPNVAWIGTFADWAYKYVPTTSEWIPYGGDSTSSGGILPDNFIYAVAIDRRGVPYFGTNKGLTRYGGPTWDTANSPLPSNFIRSLTFDRLGNLWIGTTGGVAGYNEEGIKE